MAVQALPGFGTEPQSAAMAATGGIGEVMKETGEVITIADMGGIEIEMEIEIEIGIGIGVRREEGGGGSAVALRRRKERTQRNGGPRLHLGIRRGRRGMEKCHLSRRRPQPFGEERRRRRSWSVHNTF